MTSMVTLKKVCFSENVTAQTFLGQSATWHQTQNFYLFSSGRSIWKKNLSYTKNKEFEQEVHLWTLKMKFNNK